VSVGTATVTTNFSDTSARIGSLSGGGENTTGYLSNVRVVKGTAVYTSAFTPPTTPLTAVANTSLLTLQTNQPASNSMFLDSSTNALAVTRTGNTTQGTVSPYGANWSLYTNGTNSYAYLPYSATRAIGTGDFSIECWVYIARQPANYTRVWSHQSNWGLAGSIGVELAFGTVDTLIQTLVDGNSTSYTSATYDTTGTGGSGHVRQWIHVVSSRQNGYLRLFVNGVLREASANSTNINGTSNTSFGTNSQLGGDLTELYISNFKMCIGAVPTAYSTTNTTSGTTIFTPSTTPVTTTSQGATGVQLLLFQDNRIIDRSSNAFAVTAVNNPTIQRFSPFGPQTQAAITHSAYFDGSGDYLTVPSNAAFDFGSGDFTIETWFYLAGNSSPQAGNAMEAVLFSNDDDINNGAVVSGGIALLITGNTTITGTGIFFYRRQTSGAWAEEFSYSAAIAQNTWHHVAVVKSGTNIKIFFNGSSVLSTTAVNTTFGTSAKLSSIGGRFITNYRSYLNGYISNLRVVKGTAVYTSTFTPPTTPLTAIANTSLLTCQSPTFVDNSTNAFALTAVGDAKPRTQNPFGFTNTAEAYSAAVYGGSAYFDGSGDKLTLPSSSAFDLSGNTWTIEFWMYSTATPTSGNTCRILMAGDNGGSAAWDLDYSNSGAIGFYRPYAGGPTAITTPASTIALNTWYHMAFVCNAGSARIYVNGTQVAGPVTISLPTSAAQTLRIGYDDPGTVNFNYSGYLSNIRIVKGTAVYTSNFVPPSAPLTAITNTSLLLNMTSAGIYDSASMNNLETVGDAKISTAQSKFGGSSMYFDGNGDYLAVSPNITSNLGTGNFTIEAWVYLTSASTYQFLMGSSANGGMMVGFSVPLSPTATIAVGTHNVTWFLNFGASITISSNTWTHVAITRSGSSNQAFINGVQLGPTITDSTNWSFSNNAPYIGTNALSNYLNGYVNDLRITKGYVRYTVYSATTSNTTASSIRSGSSLAGFFGSYGIFNTTAAGQYLLVDFGVSVSNIQTTYLNYNGGQWAPTSVLIQTSNDNSTWSTVVTYSDNNTNTLQTIASTGSGRYWRIYQNSATRQNSAGYEWHLGSFTMTNSFTPTTAFIAR